METVKQPYYVEVVLSLYINFCEVYEKRSSKNCYESSQLTSGFKGKQEEDLKW